LLQQPMCSGRPFLSLPFCSVQAAHQLVNQRISEFQEGVARRAAAQALDPRCAALLVHPGCCLWFAVCKVRRAVVLAIAGITDRQAGASVPPPASTCFPRSACRWPWQKALGTLLSWGSIRAALAAARPSPWGALTLLMVRVV